MKTIFITGGATGIGAACVKKFASQGYNVAFMDINPIEATRLVDILESGKILFIPGDIRSKEDLGNAIQCILARFGRLDAVFANAGIHQSNTLLDISEDELHKIIDINILGTVNTLQATVPVLKNRGGGSVVINCSDQWFVGKPHSFGYGLTKGALGQITRSLAIDLAQYNIRVNAVCPSTIDTPILHNALRRASQSSGESYDKLLAEENALFLPGRVGRAEEVAEMVYFLCSDGSKFCTGAHYLIDGGLTAQ